MEKKSLIEKWEKDEEELVPFIPILEKGDKVGLIKRVKQDLKELRKNYPNLIKEYQDWIEEQVRNGKNRNDLPHLFEWVFDTRIFGEKNE